MKKITEKEFLQRFSTRQDCFEYVYQNDYSGWNNHIILLHKNCGKGYKVTPYSLCIKNTRCPFCFHQEAGKKKRINQEEVISKFNELSKGEYELYSEYKGKSQKILVRHIKCDTIYQTSLYSFIQLGHRCKCESGLKEIKQEEALAFLENNYPLIKLIGQYNGWRNCNEFLCQKCGKTFKKRFVDFMGQKYGCVYCYQSNKRGKNNPAWRGGNSELIRALRKNIETWKFQSAKIYNNRCILTGKTGGNEVHHLSKNFMEILDETLSELNLQRYDKISDYTQEEYEKLTHTFLQKHYKYGYGVVINKKLHREFHYQFGFYNNNFDQFKQYCKEIGVEIQLENNKVITNNKKD